MGTGTHRGAGARFSLRTAAIRAPPVPRHPTLRQIRHAVLRLRGCLSALRPTERRVLMLRAGLTGPPQPERMIGLRLHLSHARVVGAERRGLIALLSAGRRGCAANAGAPRVAVPLHVTAAAPGGSSAGASGPAGVPRAGSPESSGGTSDQPPSGAVGVLQERASSGAPQPRRPVSAGGLIGTVYALTAAAAIAIVAALVVVDQLLVATGRASIGRRLRRRRSMHLPLLW
jgi:hypothetical protein